MSKKSVGLGLLYIPFKVKERHAKTIFRPATCKHCAALVSTESDSSMYYSARRVWSSALCNSFLFFQNIFHQWLCTVSVSGECHRRVNEGNFLKLIGKLKGPPVFHPFKRKDFDKSQFNHIFLAQLAIISDSALHV